jgi:cytochrome d ubiquinol oxidase subunit I
MQAQVMTKVQPMKMAAAEALYDTETGASFSLLTIGNLSGEPILQFRLPHLLSVLATNSWNGRVEGINDVQAQEPARYGPGSYTPVIWRRFWGRSIFFGSLVPAVLWGVAWGNILRGVPVDPQRIGSSPACSTVPQ